MYKKLIIKDYGRMAITYYHEEFINNILKQLLLGRSKGKSMADNSELAVMNHQVGFQNEQMSAVDRAILERVLVFSSITQALSMNDHQSKQSWKTRGLKECHRKMITNMKMTKSSQKCSICCSDFCEGKHIANYRLDN